MVGDEGYTFEDTLSVVRLREGGRERERKKKKRGRDRGRVRGRVGGRERERVVDVVGRDKLAAVSSEMAPRGPLRRVTLRRR